MKYHFTCCDEKCSVCSFQLQYLRTFSLSIWLGGFLSHFTIFMLHIFHVQFSQFIASFAHVHNANRSVFLLWFALTLKPQRKCLEFQPITK